MEVAGFFFTELRARGLPLGAVVANQVHRAEHPTPDVERLLGPRARSLAPGAAGPLLARLESAHGRLAALASLEQRRVDQLRRQAGPAVDLHVVPRLDGEVHDLVSLASLHRFLIG